MGNNKNEKVYEAEIISDMSAPNEATTAEIIAYEDVVATKSGIAMLEKPQVDFLNTVQMESHADRVKVFNSINNTTGSLADVKEPILVTDIIAHTIKVANENGKPVDATRVILVCKDGTSWGCVSEGVISSLQKLFAIFGRPTWSEGLLILPQLVKTNNGYKALTLMVKE